MKRIPLEVYEFAGDLRVMAHFILRVEEVLRKKTTEEISEEEIQEEAMQVFTEE